MGLLDRYGVNGEPQPMQVSPLTHDASNDKLARIAVEIHLLKQKHEFITQSLNSK